MVQVYMGIEIAKINDQTAPWTWFHKKWQGGLGQKVSR